VCRLLPIVDLPVAATKMPDPNIRTGLVSGGHVNERFIMIRQVSEVAADARLIWVQNFLRS